jgi:hypothetical protein
LQKILAAPAGNDGANRLTLLARLGKTQPVKRQLRQ